MYHKKLGRVHWFLWHLSPIIKNNYRITYNYALHNYTLIRYRIRKVYDIFIITRTSKRCFRVSYSNVVTNEMLYKSFSTSKACTEWVKSVYDKSLSLVVEKPP